MARVLLALFLATGFVLLALAQTGPVLQGPIPGLPLLWPVRVDPPDYSKVTGDYAQFDDVVANKHHTGIDIAGVEAVTEVRSAAGGIVFKVQGNDTNCAGCNASGCQDHGFGNTVILEHTLADGVTKWHTQYSHLANIEQTINEEVTVEANQTLGKVGRTAYGRTDCVGAHLHFEVKNFGTLGTDGGEFGYTTVHPDLIGFRDPVLNLHATTAITETEVVVTSGGDGVGLRIGPYPTTTGYRHLLNNDNQVTTASAGSGFWASAQAPETSLCSHGWYRIQELDKDYFRDRQGGEKGTSRLPDAWVCRGDGTEAFIVPVNVPPKKRRFRVITD